MYSIIQVGSGQFKIAEGDTIDVDRLQHEKDETITFDKVLFYASGNDIRIGQPYLKDVKVAAKVSDHISGKKVIAYKSKKRKNWAFKKGTRHKLTTLNITKITAN